MEKRLYFCDCCGKELEEGAEFCTIDLEGSVMVKQIWDDYASIKTIEKKRYITLYVCNDCYESEKRKGSFIIAQYESRCEEYNRRFKEYEERRSIEGMLNANTSDGPCAPTYLK